MKREKFRILAILLLSVLALAACDGGVHQLVGHANVVNSSAHDIEVTFTGMNPVMVKANSPAYVDIVFPASRRTTGITESGYDQATTNVSVHDMVTGRQSEYYVCFGGPNIITAVEYKVYGEPPYDSQYVDCTQSYTGRQYMVVSDSISVKK